MIEPNELRIGNLICRKDLASGADRFERVVHLSEEATTTGPIKVLVRYEDLQPIPLTEDWLKWCGFEGSYFPNQHGAINATLQIGYFTLYYYYFTDRNYTVYELADEKVELKHVHQLQNLYFALTGEELEIKGL